MRERDNLERKCCRKGTFRAESLKGQYESNEVRGQMQVIQAGDGH